jgi:alkanesulfonate monooxygenase SsuD/methylene tetrahydromethanopterin reductase-like flavin-dependent oxidoreductase (luciferase family)
MEEARPCHPWVAERRDRVSFALQAVAGAGGDDPGKQLLHAGRLADTYGYDAFFLGDHPAWAPECWTHLAALAVTTRRVRLGQMVAANPYRPPLLTARLASDLDRLSDGRTVLGLGIGWNAADYGLGTNEFARMGLPYPSTRERQAALEEAIAIIRGVWGAEPFTFEGAWYHASDAQVTPPVQRPGPPLVLAGAGERTLGQVARLADACNFGPGPAGQVDTPERAREKLADLRRQCELAGRPYQDILRSHFTHWVMLAEDDAAVQAKVARAFPRGLDYFWGKYLVARTPEGAIDYFQGFADAGIQYFVVQTLDPHDEETVRLLAERVAPVIRPGSTTDAAA